MHSCQRPRNSSSQPHTAASKRRCWLRGAPELEVCGPSRDVNPQPVLPMTPVQERCRHGYVRASTTTLFAALEFASGKASRSLHRHHRDAEFEKYLTKLDKEVPASMQVHQILDTTRPT